MCAAFEIVNQHLPWDVLVSLVSLAIMELLFEAAVGTDPRAGMRLANEHIDELNLIAPHVVQLLERLDRAGRDRSTVGAEVQEHRRAPQIAQPLRPATDTWQLEVRGNFAGLDTALSECSLEVVEQVDGSEVFEIVVAQILLLFQARKPLACVYGLHALSSFG
jgi:hypothetical protein